MTIPGQFDEKDRANLSDELTNIREVWWVFPDWAMVIGLLVAAGSLFYFESFTAL